MKLNEMESAKATTPIVDPCRMLGCGIMSPYWQSRIHGIAEVDRLDTIIVVDDETGLITRQVRQVDGHLGSVTEDC